MKGQRACVVWLTGLSGAGKSTIANLVDKGLTAKGRHVALLDGDVMRGGLNRDLGFSDVDRSENIRRAAEVARILFDAGLIVIVAMISPFRADRALARKCLPEGRFMEVHVDVPLSVAERRDTKGLYAKARQGRLPAFTGISSPYETPLGPDLRLDAAAMSPGACADELLHLVLARSDPWVNRPQP